MTLLGFHVFFSREQNPGWGNFLQHSHSTLDEFGWLWIYHQIQRLESFLAVLVNPGTPNNHYKWLFQWDNEASLYMGNAWKSPFPSILNWLFRVPGWYTV